MMHSTKLYLIGVVLLTAVARVNAQSDPSRSATPSATPRTDAGIASQSALASRLPPGVNQATKDAIDRGLAYLARTQDRRGAWTNRAQIGAYPVAMTALAGIALLMDGNTTTQGRYAPQVDRAVNYLMRSVNPNGLISSVDEEARSMYGHGFSMLFLSQVYGMMEEPVRAKQIHEILSKGVVLTGRAQSPAGGWIYTPDSGGDEGSVTVTQVQALRSCRTAGVSVPKDVIDKAMDYLAQSQNSDGGIRYSLRQRGGESRPPLAAAAVCCWYNAGEYENPRAKRALDFAKQKIQGGVNNGGHDYYMNLYYAQALYVGSDPLWNEYYTKRRDYLLTQQAADGSWNGDGVGDVYGTAVALIILQLPYNQLPIMQR